MNSIFHLLLDKEVKANNQQTPQDIKNKKESRKLFTSIYMDFNTRGCSMDGFSNSVIQTPRNLDIRSIPHSASITAAVPKLSNERNASYVLGRGGTPDCAGVGNEGSRHGHRNILRGHTGILKFEDELHCM